MNSPHESDPAPVDVPVETAGTAESHLVTAGTWRRRGATVVIVAYLSVLGWGVGSHAMKYKRHAHPAMYMVVWDMFCGWTAWANRFHVIGEGESGTYYELAPGPWGSFQPYGKLDRHQYDHGNVGLLKIGQNTLKQTDHEPMARIFVVEEVWAKKYNLPDPVWNRAFDEPKQITKYYRTRNIYTGTGEPLSAKAPWVASLNANSVWNNPRLKNETRSHRPVFALNPKSTNSGVAGRAISTATSFAAPQAN